MYFDITLKLVILGLLVLIQKGDADSLSEESSEEQLVGPIFPQMRIVGGSNANEGQFPHQISLRSGDSHICGGSIISANYIVTAAHCVSSGSPPKLTDASRLSIRAGSRLRTSGGQVVRVAEIKVHPSYARFANDIALLKLSSPLEFNDRVKAIALASRAPSTGVPVVTSGWGRLRNNGPLPSILQYNILTSLTNADCARRSGSVPESVICLAHRSNNGVCNGDSGGPAVYKNELVGVTNYVVNGCGSTFPDGYANVAYHLDWLKNNSDV